MSLRAIAEALGLSITTVSRALGGHGDVAPATGARVAAEAARRGYRPNHAGRRLRTGRSEAVAVVVPAEPGHFSDPFFTELLVGLGEALTAAGLDLLVTAARPGADEMAAYRRLVEGRRVDGVVVARTRVDDERIGWLLDRGVPFVTHGRTRERRAYAHVDTDGEAAFAAATTRLVGLGHRRVAMIGAPALYSFAGHREAGWRKALAAARLAPGPLAAAEPFEENGFRLAAEMLRGREAPSAIVCATDRLAVGALAAIGAAGLRAGRDVSVIGFDDLPVAAYTDPPLTTMTNPVRAMAAKIVAMLLARIDGAPAAGMGAIFAAPLVARASDGKAPARRSTPIKINQGGNHVQRTSRDP